MSHNSRTEKPENHESCIVNRQIGVVVSKYVIRVIVVFAGERIFKIDTYLANLQATWSIASHALFAVNCFP